LIITTKHFANAHTQTNGHEAAKSPYKIDNQVMLLLTDGLQNPNPLDRGDPYRFIGPLSAIQFAEKNGIRLYFTVIVAKDKEALVHQEMKPIEEAVKRTGGRVFYVENAADLEAIYKDINTIEKSEFQGKLQKSPSHLESLEQLFL